jgi:transcriptional regulator with XRE-family HTH domain
MNNGQKLAALRARLEWTQRQLADALHVNVRTLQRWENGARNCPDIVIMLVERIVEEGA